jgi:Ni/Co efflux regulator RcnB
MRKFLICLMAATILVPAAANAQDDEPRRGGRDHSERSSQRESRSEARAERAERSNADRPARAEHVDRTDRSVQLEQSGKDYRGSRTERMQQADRAGRVDRNAEPIQQVDAPVQSTRQVEQNIQPGDTLVDGFRYIARHPELANGDDHHDHHWSGDWRHDHRYDWQTHRHHHHSLFHLGHYYDPYDWGYRRWSIGFSLWPSYYGSNYWLNDPWQYRLPPAYGPYRWVRYYDDALLVNIYTGEVVDVVYNFFW